MAPCFVPNTPVHARRADLGRSVCSVTRSAPARSSKAKVSMKAEKSEGGLMDWLYHKFMHNALWEGDEKIGYEPFFKAAMSAREEEKKKFYAEQEEEKRNK